MARTRDNRTPAARATLVARELERRRAPMDRLTVDLCDLLQARARLAVGIARWKHAHGLPVADPERERAVLAMLLAGAGAGFEPATLRALLRAILRASRDLALRRVAGEASRPRARRVRRPRPAMVRRRSERGLRSATCLRSATGERKPR